MGKKQNPFVNMKAYWVRYDVKMQSLLHTYWDCRFLIYVDPTGQLTQKQIIAYVAKSQGIPKKKVRIGREIEQSITPNAFRADHLNLTGHKYRELFP